MIIDRAAGSDENKRLSQDVEKDVEKTLKKTRDSISIYDAITPTRENHAPSRGPCCFYFLTSLLPFAFDVSAFCPLPCAFQQNSARLRTEQVA